MAIPTMRVASAVVLLLMAWRTCDTAQASDAVDEEVVTPVDRSAEQLEWPWDSKNKTKPDTDNTCYDHNSCEECIESSLCHWCAHDSRCHVIGSFYGCVEGVQCNSANHTDDDKKKKKEDHSCKTHNTCTECSLSKFCHWCAFDQKCHAIGSVYGCVTGVNCYSNNRCRRQEPEHIKKRIFYAIGFLPLIMIFSSAALLLCCVTTCFGFAMGVKGAFHDLMDAATVGVPDTIMGGQTASIVNVNHMDSEPDSLHDQAASPPSEDVETTQEKDLSFTTSREEFVDASEEHEEEHAPPVGDSLVDDTNDNVRHPGGYQLMSQDELAALPPIQPETGASVFGVKRTSGYMSCLCNACGVGYAFTVMLIMGLVFISIRYYPKIPKYNICNDSLAWKSLVDGMTNMKMEASFEILASIMNDNHFDVALDSGRGSFKHKGQVVGSFELAPVTAEAMTILDVVALATFTPEKWEALSLTAEYYKGTLALDIDCQGTFRFPLLANYTYKAEFDNIHVKVNDPSLRNRELCACPKWSDVKNKTES